MNGTANRPAARKYRFAALGQDKLAFYSPMNRGLFGVLDV